MSSLTLVCLGLDGGSYRQAMRATDEDDALLGGASVSDEERYKDCERLKLVCGHCAREVILDTPFISAVRVTA